MANWDLSELEFALHHDTERNREYRVDPRFPSVRFGIEETTMEYYAIERARKGKNLNNNPRDFNHQSSLQGKYSKLNSKPFHQNIQQQFSSKPSEISYKSKKEIKPSKYFYKSSDKSEVLIDERGIFNDQDIEFFSEIEFQKKTRDKSNKKKDMMINKKLNQEKEKDTFLENIRRIIETDEIIKFKSKSKESINHETFKYLQEDYPEIDSDKSFDLQEALRIALGGEEDKVKTDPKIQGSYQKRDLNPSRDYKVSNEDVFLPYFDQLVKNTSSKKDNQPTISDFPDLEHFDDFIDSFNIKQLENDERLIQRGGIQKEKKEEFINPNGFLFDSHIQRQDFKKLSKPLPEWYTDKKLNINRNQKDKTPQFDQDGYRYTKLSKRFNFDYKAKVIKEQEAFLNEESLASLPKWM